MSVAKLDEFDGGEKHETPPHLNQATQRLLERVAVPIGSGRKVEDLGSPLLAIDPGTVLAPTILAHVARRGLPVETRYWTNGHARLWDGGPFGFEDYAAAAATDDPLGSLCRQVEDGEDVVHDLICRRFGATYLALPADTPIAEGRVPGPQAAGLLAAARLLVEERPTLVLAPPLAALERLLQDTDSAGEAPVVTSARRLKALLRRATALETCQKTVGLLRDQNPELSACRCPSRAQASVLACSLLLLPIGFMNALPTLTVVLHALTSFAFFAQGVLRLRASARYAETRPSPPIPLSDANLPRYTVLAAVYRESTIISRLVRHLAQLDYPNELMEVLILCEEDDHETIAAAEKAVAGRPNFAVLPVPPGTPRTKPRALAFGLGYACGDIVVVFDAEDRPQADQLRKAAAMLKRGPEDLAVVQARLQIEPGPHILQRQFALEYACLFDGYLPWLANGGLPLPLGGTSNHFKREALEIVGGWDPYNVTEDADLGIRLARFGFRSGVLDSATLEPAPKSLKVWVRQRSRWIKGWLMTWLVHTRDPRRLVAELGLGKAAFLQAHLVAVVLSPLCYPFGIGLSVCYAAGLLSPPGQRSFPIEMAVAASVLSVTVCVVGTIWLARLVAPSMARRPRWSDLAAIPAYWMLSSLAAWIAAVELLIKPHYWAKTPHCSASHGVGEDS